MRIAYSLLLSLFVFFADAQKSSTQVTYTRLVKQGDSLYYNHNCKAALDSFRRAAVLIKKEMYASQRVKEIEQYMKLPDSLKRKCTCYKQPLSVELHDKMIRKYVRLMASIDSALYVKDHNKVNALMLEADKMKIREYINDKRLGIEFDNLYALRMMEGNKAFAEKDYNTAKIKYQEASAIKPMNPEPGRKMAEVDKCIKQDWEKKPAEEKYKDLVAEGDRAFTHMDFNGAKAKYTEAAVLMPNEQYPKDKLAICDKKIKEGVEQRAIQAKYNQAVVAGDRDFANKDYAAAKAKYTEASAIKPTEQYPKDQVKLCDQKLKEEKK